MENKPTYAIESVDHALHLVQLLQQEGPLGVTEAADRLGVARSTAHRLFAMLVYRGFAERGSDRRYHPGAALRASDERTGSTALLRRVATPRVHALVARLNETVNLLVRVGTEVRFVVSVESHQALRVGDRAGRVLPAHRASGGKVLLAALGDEEVRELYAFHGDDVDVPQLLAELRLVRERKFAINEEGTERGVTAVGVLVRGQRGTPVAGLSAAMPSSRFRPEGVTACVSALTATARRIEKDLVGAERRPRATTSATVIA